MLQISNFRELDHLSLGDRLGELILEENPIATVEDYHSYGDVIHCRGGCGCSERLNCFCEQ